MKAVLGSTIHLSKSVLKDALLQESAQSPGDILPLLCAKVHIALKIKEKNVHLL